MTLALIVFLALSVGGGVALEVEDKTSSSSAEEEDLVEVDKALNVGLSILLVIHVAVVVCMLFVQKPWRICCYPSTSFKAATDTESRIYG